MSVIGSNILAGVSGSAAGEGLYADDVFSTYLYEGNGSARTITNDIDLAGEGGMVWIKRRDGSQEHILGDTERTNFKVLRSDDTAAEFGGTNYISQYNNDGFSLGTDAGVNANTQTYASWTFRKAPGFFDVVTYSGNGSTQTISHNLGSVPGCIIIKRINSTSDWTVYHRSLGNNKQILLNLTNSEGNFGGWNNTTPTSTSFYLGNDAAVNSGSGTYVAYLFAHDDQSFGTGGDESIIKCGSYTGNGTSQEINLGFEPQFLILKISSGDTGNWYQYDTMRGWTVNSDNQNHLLLNTSAAEGNVSLSGLLNLSVTSTGFKLNNADHNGNLKEYIYMAIRRPHKPPEAATEVFAVNTESNDNNYSTTGFPVDAAISVNRDGSSHTSLFGAKLIGDNVLRTGLTGTEQSYLTYNTAYAFMDKFRYAFWGSNTNGFVNYAFKRAPGFFDIVAYTANNNTAFNVNHNLGVAPELVIIKDRDSTRNWLVGADALTGWGNYGLKLDDNSAENTSSNYFTAAPTSTQIKLGTASLGNYGTNSYIAYLFASLDGISKVGSYTGTGSDINVDCGFTTGARLVLIKRTDSTGNWFVFDTARGIVSGNDPFMRLNLINAENTGVDMIDPLNAGFSVASGTTDVNASGGTYLFLAIA